MKNLILLPFIIFFINLFGQTPELIFHSGFEPNTIDTSNGVASDILGVDNSVSPPNDWVNHLDSHPNIGTFSIQYEGGDDTMRLAEIVPDPTNTSNSVLKFWIKYPNVSGIKGRVQANIYNNNNIYNLFYSIRMYLPSDFNILKYISSEIKWLTLMEFWNNPPWDQNYGFRISVDLQKIGILPDSLRLGVHAQTYDTISASWLNVWDTTNMSFAVPVAKWMTININYIEGDSSTGKFYLSVTPDGGSKTIIFDIANHTHHPLDLAPDGLSHFNPFKLYTFSELIDSLTNSGRLLHVYWDDFELWKDSSVTTSISEFYYGDKTITIYPNPFTNKTAFVFDNAKNNNHILELFDNQGRLVRTMQHISTGKIEIERKNLKSGLYLFVLKSNNELVGTGKFVID